MTTLATTTGGGRKQCKPSERDWTIRDWHRKTSETYCWVKAQVIQSPVLYDLIYTKCAIHREEYRQPPSGMFSWIPVLTSDQCVALVFWHICLCFALSVNFSPKGTVQGSSPPPPYPRTNMRRTHRRNEVGIPSTVVGLSLDHQLPNNDAEISY